MLTGVANRHGAGTGGRRSPVMGSQRSRRIESAYPIRVRQRNLVSLYTAHTAKTREGKALGESQP
jgi:hypothetical protein